MHSICVVGFNYAGLSRAVFLPFRSAFGRVKSALVVFARNRQKFPLRLKDFYSRSASSEIVCASNGRCAQ